MGNSEADGFYFHLQYEWCEESKSVRPEKWSRMKRFRWYWTRVLKNSGLAYTVKDGAIAIRPVNEVKAAAEVVNQEHVISGTSQVDEQGEPVQAPTSW